MACPFGIAFQSLNGKDHNKGEKDKTTRVKVSDKLEKVRK
jgi:hypothetical protein